MIRGKKKELPEDMVSEILLRLPVKSLLRFRCVHKNWCTEIDTLHFKEKHLAYRSSRIDDYDADYMHIIVKRKYRWRHHDDDDDDEIGNTKKKKKLIFTFYSDYESLANWKPSYTLDPGMYPASTSFSVTVNGVVWVINYKNHDFNIIFFNPALRKYTSLPQFYHLPVEFHFLQDPGCIFIPGAIGFGFDEFNKEYILVQLVYNVLVDDTDPKCVVYNLSTNSWTMVEIPAFMSSTLSSYFYEDRIVLSSFYSYGCIHWCIGWWPSCSILTFNTTSKLFGVIECPQGWKDFESSEIPNIFMIDSSRVAFLASYFGRDGDGVHALDVWVMMEYGVAKSWTKRYCVKSVSEIGKPLCFWRKDKLLFKTKDAKIGCYDLYKGQACEPRQCDSIFLPYSDFESLEVVICHESLVSVDDQCFQTRPEKKHLLTGA